MIKKMLCVFLLLTGLSGALPRPVQAGIIEFEAIDLVPDVGGDLWQYRYFLSGFVFDAAQGFTIFASPALYRQLSTPGAPNPGWDPLVVQPDPVLLSDGYLDELALQNGASLSAPFILNFVWLGGLVRPGSQRYVIYESNPQGALTVIAEGQTQPLRQAPEPGTVALLALGTLLVAVRRRLTRL